MKAAAFALALMLSGAALAQDYPGTGVTPPEDTAADTSFQSTTIAGATGQIVQPGNVDPEHDARGIPVISDPATAPAGFNQAPGTNAGVGGPLADPSAAPAPQPADADYPACTRDVTDNCVQAYERGRSPQ